MKIRARVRPWSSTSGRTDAGEAARRCGTRRHWSAALARPRWTRGRGHDEAAIPTGLAADDRPGAATGRLSRVPFTPVAAVRTQRMGRNARLEHAPHAMDIVGMFTTDRTVECRARTGGVRGRPRGDERAGIRRGTPPFVAGVVRRGAAAGRAGDTERGHVLCAVR